MFAFIYAPFLLDVFPFLNENRSRIFERYTRTRTRTAIVRTKYEIRARKIPQRRIVARALGKINHRPVLRGKLLWWDI